MSEQITALVTTEEALVQLAGIPRHVEEYRSLAPRSERLSQLLSRDVQRALVLGAALGAVVPGAMALFGVGGALPGAAIVLVSALAGIGGGAGVGIVGARRIRAAAEDE